MKRVRSNGFTLVEMIGIIAALAILSLTVTPIISNVIKSNKRKLYDRQIDGIIESARVWGANNIGRLPKEGDENVEITLGELKKDGYAKIEINNPIDGEPFDDENTIVIISNNNGILKYEVIINE